VEFGSGETDQRYRGFSSAAELGCAIIAAIEMLGYPWSMLVLRDVIFGRSSARVFGDTPFAAKRLTTRTASCRLPTNRSPTTPAWCWRN
jgi:DNA-binding HxlR family transcriptional regulator